MRPMFKYFGSKWNVSKKHPQPKGIVCEPFAGSAGYSCFYEPEICVLVDIDERVCALWDYLIHASESDILSIPLVKLKDDIRDIKMSDENRLLLSCWINVSPFRNIVQLNGDKGGAWGEGIRARTAENIKKIRKWKVIQGDYRSAPESGTTYVDPPYQSLAEHYRGKKLDYNSLAEWCKSRAGLVIVCEGTDATWLPFEKMKTKRAIRGGSREINNFEAFWTNEEKCK